MVNVSLVNDQLTSSVLAAVVSELTKGRCSSSLCMLDVAFSNNCGVTYEEEIGT